MSGRRRRTVAILGAAVVLAIVSACGPAEGSLDAVRDQVNAVGSPPAGAAKSAAHLVVTPARATVGFGAPLKIAFMLAAAGSPLSGQDVAVAVGGNSLRSTTDARGGGSVTFPSGVLPAGRHRVTASYAGGPEVLASSTGATVTVQPAVAAVTLTITPTDTGGFTVQARLRTSTAVAAGGAVTFAVDRAALGQRPVRAGRAAIAVPASLGVGNHVVMATYLSSNAAQVANTTATSTISVSKAATSVSAAAEQETVRYGDQASLAISVKVVGARPGVDLTGAVRVTDGATVIADGVTDAAGRASLSFLDTADPGSTTYQVTFGGSGAVKGSKAEFVVRTSQTNVDVAIDAPTDVLPGKDATISAAVIGTPRSPTGTASLTVDGKPLAKTALADGKITAVVPAVAAGDHEIRVRYAGDARFHADEASATLSAKEPVANPNQGGAAAVQAGNPCPATASACVDLSGEQAWLQSGGRVTYGPVPITSGRDGHRTDDGMFSVYWRDRNHLSSIFGDAPMPNSVFFDGGIAFHAGSLSDQSHGCVHLSYDASEVFFDTLSVGDGVYVWGAAPY